MPFFLVVLAAPVLLSPEWSSPRSCPKNSCVASELRVIAFFDGGVLVSRVPWGDLRPSKPVGTVELHDSSGGVLPLAVEGLCAIPQTPIPGAMRGSVLALGGLNDARLATIAENTIALDSHNVLRPGHNTQDALDQFLCANDLPQVRSLAWSESGVLAAVVDETATGAATRVRSVQAGAVPQWRWRVLRLDLDGGLPQPLVPERQLRDTKATHLELVGFIGSQKVALVSGDETRSIHVFSVDEKHTHQSFGLPAAAFPFVRQNQVFVLHQDGRITALGSPTHSHQLELPREPRGSERVIRSVITGADGTLAVSFAFQMRVSVGLAPCCATVVVYRFPESN